MSIHLPAVHVHGNIKLYEHKLFRGILMKWQSSFGSYYITIFRGYENFALSKINSVIFLSQLYRINRKVAIVQYMHKKPVVFD